MGFLSFARPAWAESFGRAPAGWAAWVAAPIAVAALLFTGAAPARVPALLALGWAVVGFLPPVLVARPRDPGLALRVASLPMGPAGRWLAAMATHKPPAVLASLAVAAPALARPHPGLAPAGLLLVAMLCAASYAAWGVALGALVRRPWHRAGLVALVLLLSAWAVMPGAPAWMAQGLPTGQALAALALFPKGLTAASQPLVALAGGALVAVIVGVLAFGRR